MMRRRRPLLRGAMVGGAGYIAGKSAAKSSARESESQQAAPAAPAAAASGVDPKIEELTKLGQLRDSGVLSPEEFEAEKQRILAS